MDSLITLKTEELSKRQWEKLFLALTFRDADDEEVSAFQYLSGRDEVLLPRGAWSLVPKQVKVNDMRSRPTMRKCSYTRTLDAPDYEGQSGAVTAMFKHEQGQVIAPPGRGKTEICLAWAAQSRTRVLVVVHTHDLLKQWEDRARVSVPGMTLGKIQGKTCQVEHLTIATAQTLKKYLHKGGSFWRQFGAVIVDEAHHAAAETWEWLLNVCPAYYRFGVTASEKRSDGRQALVKFNIGPVIYKLKFKSGVPITVVPIQTKFHSRYNGNQYARIMQKLVRDEDRNALIAGIVKKEVEEGNSILVLSRQIIHLENIQDHINLAFGFDEGWTQQVELVSGQISKRKRDEMIARLTDGSLRCILGTQLFEEGVDIPRLNRIVLAFPGTEITALQKVGRGARKFEGKDETIIYDLLDDLVRVLAKQFLRRKLWYKGANGITLGKVVKNEGKAIKDAEPEAKEGRGLRDRLRVARPRRDG